MSAWRPLIFRCVSPGVLAGVLVGALLWTIGGGCSDDPPSAMRVYYDLVARHRLARIRAERRHFDLTVPGVHRYLGEGWLHRDPKSVDWTSGPTWAVGERSTLSFFLLQPRPLVLSLRCRPFEFPNAPAQTLRVEVGGRFIADLVLEQGVTTYRVEIPEPALRAGENEIVFHHGRNAVPAELGASVDEGALAVAWYSIEILPGSAVRLVAEVGDAERVLHIQHGVRLDHYFELLPGSRLILERIDATGSPPGSLAVTLLRETGEERQIARLPPGEKPRVIPIAVDAPEIVRLSLAALPSPGTAPEGRGLTLRAPVIALGEAEIRTASSPSPEPEQGAGSDSRPNVIVYLVDTLRADHVGSYGYSRAVTPNIDEFAAGATLFEHVVAQSSWTRASVASLFTGVWPHAHGANQRTDVLAPEWETLAERLRAAGYQTAAFIANANLAAPFGLGQGFDLYEVAADGSHEEGGPRAEALVESALAWLDQRDQDTAFFLYLHALDPHTPYRAPAAYRELHASAVPAEVADDPERYMRELRERSVTGEDVERLAALYDAEVAYSDAQFGALLAQLESRGLLDDALVIFLSDHGEEFHEHGDWTHARSLHRESVQIPLIVKYPDQHVGSRVSAPVQHTDLLPTVLRVVGLSSPAGLDGRALRRPSDEAVSAGDGRSILSHLDIGLHRGSAILDGPWKLIQMNRGGTVQSSLYNWHDDPGELRDLSGSHPVRAGYLAARLRERTLEGEGHRAPAVQLDPELEARLRALGYF